MSRATKSSACGAIRRSMPCGATGVASTVRVAPRARATCSAAIAVDPVAMPSSTMIAVLPVRSRRGRSPRNRLARRSSSVRSAASTAASCSALAPTVETMSSLRTRTPPSPIAPMPSSSCPGVPSLRTTITSSGAPRAVATSAATGTPPRGRPRTTTSAPRRWSSAAPNRRPASTRSANLTLAIQLATAVDS